MHLELTEVLVCPECGPGHGLIAFVDRMEERRIVEGRLDCPMCERRHPVRGGAVYLGERPSDVPSAAPSAESPAQARSEAPDLGLPPRPAETAAALLGPPEGSEVLLAAAGAGSLADAIADLRPEAAIVAWGVAPPVVHSRVYPVLPGERGKAGALPVRSGGLDGAVLAGDVDSELLAEVVRALSAGSRLVILAPGADVRPAASENLRELASDPRAWVGSRA